jgi:hypothetical protein
MLRCVRLVAIVATLATAAAVAALVPSKAADRIDPRLASDPQRSTVWRSTNTVPAPRGEAHVGNGGPLPDCRIGRFLPCASLQPAVTVGYRKSGSTPTLQRDVTRQRAAARIPRPRATSGCLSASIGLSPRWPVIRVAPIDRRRERRHDEGEPPLNGEELAVLTRDSSDTTSRRGVFGVVAGGLLALGLAGTQSAAARRGGRRRHGRGGRRGNGSR